MENSVGANRLRQFFYNKNCQDVTRYGYGTPRAAWDALLNPSTADWSSTAAQVDGWGPASATNNARPGGGAISIRPLNGQSPSQPQPVVEAVGATDAYQRSSSGCHRGFGDVGRLLHDSTG